MKLYSWTQHKTQRRYEHADVQLFNKLPSSAMGESVEHFKSVLEGWLKNKSFSSIEEWELAGNLELEVYTVIIYLQ